MTTTHNKGNLLDLGVSDKRLLVRDTEFASTLVRAQRRVERGLSCHGLK